MDFLVEEGGKYGFMNSFTDEDLLSKTAIEKMRAGETQYARDCYHVVCTAFKEDFEAYKASK